MEIEMTAGAAHLDHTPRKRVFWIPVFTGMTLILILLFTPNAAYAACASPTAAEGDMIYNDTHNVMQFCDGTNWIGMAGGATGTSETDPKIGTLTNTKWCTTDGSVVNCTSDTPSASLSGGTAGYLGVWTDATTLGKSSTSAGQQLFWDSTNHRLGIGLTAPTQKLDVVGSATATSVIFKSQTGLAAPVSGSGLWSTNGTNVWRLTGNVSIGTATPAVDANTARFLTLQGDTTQYAEINVAKSLTGTSDYIGGFNFANTALGTAEKRLAYIWTQANGAANTGRLILGTNIAGSMTDRVFIDSSGLSVPNGTISTAGSASGGTFSGTSIGIVGISTGGGGCSVQLAWNNAGGINWTNCPSGFSSDRRLKKDIEPIDDGLELIMALKPVTYHWKKDGRNTPLINDPTQKVKRYGFIAQDVLEVIPSLVIEGEMDLSPEEMDPDSKETKAKRYSLDYEGFISPLVKAVQELKAENDALRAALAEQNAGILKRLDALEAK